MVFFSGEYLGIFLSFLMLKGCVRKMSISERDVVGGRGSRSIRLCSVEWCLRESGDVLDVDGVKGNFEILGFILP